MSEEVVVHGFETSNNMKVRVALGYKQIPYRFSSIDPGDRETIVRLSGQHLTPVLQHGQVVLSDSAAILRYLEANFPDRPRLFGNSVAEQWAIEDWELFARTELAGPLMEVVHTRVTGGEVDDALIARCSAAFDAAVAKLALGLSDRRWLVGDALTAADITAGAVMHRIRLAGMFPLPAAVDPLLPWIDGVMSYDGKHRQR
jgi:glutathione S-transferase